MPSELAGLPPSIKAAAKAEFETMDVETLSWYEFEAGVSWLYEHLSKDVEFDGSKAREYFFTHPEQGNEAYCFENGAHWQFDQMRARIGLAEND